MTIVVIGAGAVGSFLGGTLAAAGHQVTLLRRRAIQAQQEQLTIRDPDGRERTVTVTVAGSAASMAQPPDLVVVAVKMPDLPGAIDTVAAWPAATVLAVQNGVGADDLIVAGRPDGGVIAGSLTASVSIEGGEIRRSSRGGIGLAPVRGEVATTVDQLTAAFATGGLPARAFPDAPSMRWSKLVANLLANATCAILDVDPSVVYADRDLFRVELRQLREAQAVMRGLGLRAVALPGADVRLLGVAGRLPERLVRPVLRRLVAGGRGGKSPSLRVHLSVGSGPSEVDWLNGAVARAAADLGQGAPINAALAHLVRQCGRDAGRRAWFKGRPDRLLEAMPGR